MEIIKIVLIGIIAAAFTITIKSKQPEIAFQISIVSGLLIFIFIVNYLSSSVEYIKEIVNKFSIPISNITIVLKIIGVSYICEFATQILNDAGEKSTASLVELSGRVVIIAMTLPLLGAFIEMVTGLL